MNKLSPSLIGFLQALAMVIYCVLISGLFRFLEKSFVTMPPFWGFALILILLVFSAAVTGSIIFGYSVYLVLKQRIKEALSVFIYTLLYSLGAIVIALILLFVLL